MHLKSVWKPVGAGGQPGMQQQPMMQGSYPQGMAMAQPGSITVVHGHGGGHGHGKHKKHKKYKHKKFKLKKFF